MLLTVIEQGSKYDVPTGTYNSKLVGFKEMPANPNFQDSKPSWVWEFEVLDGPHAGKVSSRFTPMSVTTQNGLGKMMRELLGRPIVANECIDASKLIGSKCQITVGWNKSGTKTKVILCGKMESSQANTLPGTMPPPPPAPQIAPPPPSVAVQPSTANAIRQTPETYIIWKDGKQEIVTAMVAQQMVAEQKFKQGDKIFDPEKNDWFEPTQVLLPF